MTDREKLIELLLTEPWTIQARGNSKRFAAAGRVADHLLANGVVVREKGEWDRFTDEYEICATEFTCPVCKESFGSSEMTDEEFVEMMNFCPNCGADMRGAKSE